MGGTPYQFTDGDLVSALNCRQFEISLQPQFALDSGAIVACEAMVRWRHPMLGVLPAGVFLNFVQECKRTGELTQCILKQGLSAMEAWREAGKDWNLCFNIFSSDLLEPDFAMQARMAADKARIDPSTVIMEVAETELFAAGPHARRGLERIREAGFLTALDAKGAARSDDEGLLESGLFTQFKIGGPPLLRIAAATALTGGGVAGERVREAQALGLTCVAVGVESAIMSPALLALGFDRAQGAAFQKPTRPERLLEAYREAPAGAEMAVLRNRGARTRRRRFHRPFGQAV